jgi:hypothetical protein
MPISHWASRIPPDQLEFFRRTGRMPTPQERMAVAIEHARTQPRPQALKPPGYKAPPKTPPQPGVLQRVGQAAKGAYDYLTPRLNDPVLKGNMLIEGLAGAMGGEEGLPGLHRKYIQPMFEGPATALGFGDEVRRSLAAQQQGLQQLGSGISSLASAPDPTARTIGQYAPSMALPADPASAMQSFREAGQKFGQGQYWPAALAAGLGALDVTPFGGETRAAKGLAGATETSIDAALAAQGGGTAGNIAKALTEAPGVADEVAKKAARSMRAAAGEVPEALSPPLQTVVKQATDTSRMKAGKGQRGMMAVPNLRDMTLDDAIVTARTEPHLIQSKDGQYVGGPRGVKTREQIQKMRDDFDAQLARGIEGAGWYDIARAGNELVAGPDPKRQSLLARALALFSAQANPDTNLGTMLEAHNAFELGEPAAIARTGQQARTYNRARQTGQPISLGKKTDPYGVHLDPTVPHGTTGVNDIWHARAFGYTGKDGKPFDKALSDQEHQFLDYETILATERANARKLGGRDNWTAHEIQAAPWVAGKGEELARGWAVSDASNAAKAALKKAKTPEARAQAEAALAAAANAQPTAAHLERGYMEAAKSYPEFFNKYTGYSTHERAAFHDIPGKSKQELTSWIDPVTERDILLDAAGMLQRPALPATGFWQPEMGPLEMNEATASRPLIGLQAEGAGIGPKSRKLWEGAETWRGFTGLQGATAGHIPITHAKSSQMGSLTIPFGGPADPATLPPLMNLGTRWGLPDISDTGKAVTMTSFDPNNPPPTGTQMAQYLPGQNFAKRTIMQGPPTASGQTPFGLTKQIQSILGPNVEPQRASVHSVYRPMWSEMEGAAARGPTGVVTDEFLNQWSQYTPQFRNQVENDPAILAKLQADIDLLNQTHKPGDVNADQWHEAIINALTILKEKGSAGLDAARKSGVILPAAAAFVIGASQLMPQDQEAQAAGPQGRPVY